MNKKFKKLISHIKTYGKKTLGIILIILGIPGLVLPFLQGILMITTGIILLGNKKLLNKMKKVTRYLKDLFTCK